MNKELKVAIEYANSFVPSLEKASTNSMFTHEANRCLFAIRKMNDSKMKWSKDSVDIWVWQAMQLLRNYGNYLYNGKQNGDLEND